MKPASRLALGLVAGLAALTGLLVMIVHFRAGLLIIILYAIGLLLAVALAMAQLWLKPVRCERALSADVVNAGDSVQVITRLFNRAPWPILWMFAEETLPENMSREGTWRRFLFIPPRRAVFLHYRLTLARRGCHTIGPIVMQSGDVFGLFKRCRVDRRRDFVTALPPYSIIEEFDVGQRRRLADLSAKRSLLDDPTRPSGVREYRRGDPLKHIHWKSSARTGQLRTKIYEPVTEASATVVLDFNAAPWRVALTRDPARPPHEQAVEVAASVCRYLIDGNWKVGFLSNGRDPLGLPGVTMAQAVATDSLRDALDAARIGQPDDRLDPIFIPARSGQDQFFVIHENLGRLSLSDGLSIDEALAVQLPHIDREQVLVVIVGDVTDPLVTSLARARTLGWRVMLMIVCNNTAHDRAFEQLVPHGVELHRMDEDWRLRELATGRSAM